MRMSITQILDQINNISIAGKDKIAPVEVLKQLNGGRSGAGVYMVEYGPCNKVGILKITESNEAATFTRAYELASKNNMHKFIAGIIANYKINVDGERSVHANLYDLAGDDIYKTRTFLDKVLNEDELSGNMVSKLTKFIFTWNREHEKVFLSPLQIVRDELYYRYMDEKYVQAFEEIGVDRYSQWISLDGTDLILPNPFYYFNDENRWGDKKVACLTSFVHGDFQGDNIIITENKPVIIDFCDIIENCNIFHDLRYLESITIGDYLDIDSEKDRVLWAKVCESISENILEVNIPQGRGMSLLRQLLPQLRENMKLVVSDSRNTLYNPSFYLAGVACGLINMRKYKSALKKKSAFIYAAFNLKMFLKDEALDMYNPSLNSCIIFNWKNSEVENSRIVLEPVI
jgi:thiamine kinase-like enzyme